MAWVATLQQFVKPLQLFFSFCLNLELIPLFLVYAAAVCILIAIVPVSAAVMAARIPTAIARFFIVVVWFIYYSLLKDSIIIFELRKLLLFLNSYKY
jgi:hypothetical protein